MTLIINGITRLTVNSSWGVFSGIQSNQLPVKASVEHLNTYSIINTTGTITTPATLAISNIVQ